MDPQQAYDVFTQQASVEAPPKLRTGLPVSKGTQGRGWRCSVLTPLPMRTHAYVQTLDGALRLGVPLGSITELVGPGGVGKSQLSHMLTVEVALPAALGG
jgi:hypothetical protein